MKNSVCWTLILLGLVASSGFLLVSAPASEQTVVPTSVLMAIKPNPIGVGQRFAVEFQVVPAPPTSSDRFGNITVGVISPGKGPAWLYRTANATGGATQFWAFWQPGNYVFRVNFRGQSFENGQVYAPSENEMTIVVQDEPVATPIGFETPNPPPTPPAWLISPEFTATFKRASYNVVNYTTGETQQVDNSTVEFKITNQPLTGGLTSIHYLLRITEPDWICDYYTDSTCKRQSNTSYTVLTFPLYDPYMLPPNLQNASSINFQIQAQTNLGESDWSPIHTVYLTETPSPPPTATVAAPPASKPTPSPRPTPKPTWTPPPRIETDPTKGSIVRMTLAGNVTPAQFSDITLTSESGRAAQLSFVLSGQAGNTGFGNITVPKTAVPNAASIEVLIDGQPAQNQGYSQNANCYYVWFTTHFSSHQISIVFSANAPPSVTATPNSSPVQISLTQILFGVAVAVVITGIIIGGLLALNRERRQKPMHNR